MGKFKDHAMHESISRTMKSLRTAEKFAKESRDVEALILISERWMALMQKIEDIDVKSVQQLGFVVSNGGELIEG